jgi:16S rRNA (adenine1518-N6/adenine1519-N6)-dimethyltransferase
MRPKKSLGQNFLINPKVAERIALEADISKKDTVLEIGPGKGYLTKYLLAKAGKVVAVEKDEHLANELAEKYKKEVEENKLVIIKKDILYFKMELGEGKDTLRNYKNYKIVANIPYNITGAILKQFLTEKNKPQSMTLMIQKEVAERILAQHGKESLLSISVKAYGNPKILFRVSRGNFFPSPNVDSAVINIKNISNKNFAENDLKEEVFWEILHAGFAHKRKKLSSNLKKWAHASFLTSLENKRAEELTTTDWIHIVKTININKKE